MCEVNHNHLRLFWIAEVNATFLNILLSYMLLLKKHVYITWKQVFFINPFDIIMLLVS